MSTFATALAAANDNTVNFKEPWDQLWASLTGSTGTAGLFNLLAVVGVAVIVLSIITWVWQRRKAQGFQGSGRQSGGVMAAILVGVLFVSPQLLIPLALGLFDILANAFIYILGQVGDIRA